MEPYNSPKELIMTQRTPHIIGIGGTGSPNSSSERILRHALAACERHGATTMCFDGGALDMPMYAYTTPRTDKAVAFIAALRSADGVIIASPGYHGTVSGLIKNALDYVEDMAKDENVYFEGRSVGLIAVAAGWQATGTTLATLRSITHALRGWPTPMALAVNSAVPVFNAEGDIVEPAIANGLNILAQQVVSFAQMKALHELAKASGDAAHDG